MILLQDVCQLPPANSNPYFLATDQELREACEFRMLRENRRVVPATADETERQAILDNYHEVLGDIAASRPTARVRQFLIDA